MQNLTTPVVPSILVKTGAYRYRAGKNGWKHIHLNKQDGKKCPSNVRIITWNISFDMVAPIERLDAALRHIRADVLGCRKGDPPEPCCILLQELLSEAFPRLLEDPWVREHFVVAPVSRDKWPPNAAYGNVTLISRSVPIVDCSVVHFGSSIYHRTGIIVDIRLRNPSYEPDGESHPTTCVLRIINTHLESMPSGHLARRLQLQLLSKMLFLGGKWRGGIIAGDMNAIGPNEHKYPAELGLEDAWRGEEEDEDGYTWGYQVPSQFPAARLDKVLYLLSMDHTVDEPNRVGVGVSVRDPTSGKDLPLFVSDHYGLDTTLRMT